MGTLESEIFTDQDIYDSYIFFTWVILGIKPIQVINDFWEQEFNMYCLN